MFPFTARPIVTITSSVTNNDDITVSTGASFLLNCTDSFGDPSSTFSWTRNDNQLPSNGSVTIQQLTDHISQLTITDIQPQLAGLYKCTASNSIGSNSDMVTINVKCKLI